MMCAAALFAALFALPSAQQNCSKGVLFDTDLCGGDPGYRTTEVPGGDAAASHCADLCCAQSDFCWAWVTRPVTVASGNCRAGTTCCWTKPQCNRASNSPGTTSGTVVRPRGGTGFVDTEGWLGSSYTPARAANTLWWAHFDDYEADIRRELAAARRVLRLPALRVFLHTLAFQAVGAAKHAEYLERFLAIAHANNIRVGLVLFGDSWNHGPDLPHAGNYGANLSCAADGSECCPRSADGFVGVKGCSNGCWFANPQDHQRGDPGSTFGGAGTTNASFIERSFRPYVEAIAGVHRNDSRVLWWEVYNEPCEWRHFEARICTMFQVISATLIKEGAYAWLKSLRPAQPVISCWAEHNNTFSDILDVHLYNAAFASWNAQVFSECELNATDAPSQCSRGAVVTEAGARWFQGMGADAGSPLAVLNYLASLRAQRRTGVGAGRPFVPGAMLAWELMVGNTNTRWAAGPPCVPQALAREPTIPWCGLLWPDGTPVSFTEAAAVRAYAGAGSDFLFFDNFLADSPELAGDTTLSLNSSSKPWNRTFGVAAAGPAGGGVVELAFWLDTDDAVARLQIALHSDHEAEEAWELVVSVANITLSRLIAGAGPAVELGAINASALECGIAVNAWNLLRTRLVTVGTTERIEVYFNPTAHPISHSPGSVTPRMNFTALSAGETPQSTRRVSLQPVRGAVKIDYVSALPADGGIAAF